MNDMKLIMENWRQYNAELLHEDKKRVKPPILLIDDNPDRVFSDPMEQVLFEHGMGERKFEDVALILERHIDTQYELILNEGLLDKVWAFAEKQWSGAPEYGTKMQKAYYLAKKALWVGVYKPVGVIIKLMNTGIQFVTKTVGGLIKKIGEDTAAYLESKEQQSKIVKVLMGVARKIRTVLAPLKRALEGIAKFAYGEKTRFPVFKGLILTVAAVAAMLALTCGSLFGGALAFAPLYAGRKFGIAFGLKGAKAGLAKAKTALAKKRDAAQAMAEQLLKEVVSEVEEIAAVSAEIWTVAKAFLVQALETTPDPEAISHFGSVAAQSVTDTGPILDSEAANVVVTYWDTNNVAMDNIFRALEDMDMAQYQPENLTPERWEELSEPIQKAIFHSVKMAKAHCESDPAACAGADLLAGDIRTVLHNVDVAHETVRASAQVAGEATEAVMSAGDQTQFTRIRDAWKAYSQGLPELSPEAASDLAKELGLDEKVPARLASAYASGDTAELATLGKYLGLADEDTWDMGAERLEKLLLGMGMEPGDAQALGSATGKAMLKKVDIELQEIVRQETEHFILMEEIRAF